MSGSARVRLRLLCEDPRQKRFLEALCDAWGIETRQRRVEFAPSGRGDAKRWIERRYGDAKTGEVRFVRSKKFQKNLGLLVMIDGDNQGPDVRRRELDEALDAAGLPRRASDEPIAILVPTWSIETWLLWLWGDTSVDELGSFKEDGRAGGPERAARFRAANVAPNTVASAARAFGQPRAEESALVPSLADARAEALARRLRP